jgi:Domain of unknown function (DUF5666)/Domain of unknown function (DUF4382)
MKPSIARFSLALITVFSLLVLADCGNNANSLTGAGGDNGGSGSAQMVPASFSIGDTPPSGVSILRFQIELTAASMQPSASGQQPVSMLPTPATVELTHLQTESALLANLSVPAGTYASLMASFADPQMTILNRSTSTYTVGGQQCAPSAICTLTPTLNQSSVMDESAPFPLTLSSTSPVAFVLHFDVNASVQGDLSVSPTISLKELPPLPNGALEQFHVDGRITAVSASTSSFTLQTGFGNLSLDISTSSSTQYQFGSTCAADTFSCLMVGEVVRVGINGMSSGTLVATDVELLAPQGMPALEGIVIGVNTAKNQIQLALMDFQDNAQGNLASAKMAYGLSLTVQFSSSTTFNIDTDGITLPSAGLSFASVNDMIVGQTLAVQPILSSIQISGTPPPIQITFTANNVRLESSELTATVDTVSPPSFLLSQLPPLFTGATPAITEIDVETVTGTNFENISGVSALSGGDAVSVGGLLFNTATTPTMIAERVMQR